MNSLDSNLIAIDENDGQISVDEIDRDALKIDFFPFNVSRTLQSNREIIINELNLKLLIGIMLTDFKI